MSSEYYPRKKDNCGCSTVIVTFTSADGYPITFSASAGSVSCLALLTVGFNAVNALQCLFEDGFKIVAFTANGAENTYTLKKC